MYTQDVDNDDVTFSDRPLHCCTMPRKASTMSDSASIDLVIESTKDGAQSYKSVLVSIHIIK